MCESCHKKVRRLNITLHDGTWMLLGRMPRVLRLNASFFLCSAALVLRRNYFSPVLSPRAVRDCAIGPATPEQPLEPARLGEAVLEKLWLADEPGGVPVFREVLRSKDR